MNLTEVLKILGQVFSEPRTKQQIYLNQKNNIDSNTNENIIHIRKNGIVAEFESKIKKQLNILRIRFY